MVDGAVLVIKAESTPFDAVKRAVDALGRERIVGVLLNRALNGAVGRYGYSYSYDQYYGPGKDLSRS
jgi:hypothetical protein